MITFANKSTHIQLLITGFIVLIGLYLYLTIKDIKRLNIDLSKTNNDVISLSTIISRLKNEIDQLKNDNSLHNNMIQSLLDINADSESITEEEDEQDDDEDEEEPDENIADDIKELVDSIPEDIIEDVPPETSIIQESETSLNRLPDLKRKELENIQIDQLKNIAKEYKMSTKGTKDTIIDRLSPK
jgi:chromosome segregation ATPase